MIGGNFLFVTVVAFLTFVISVPDHNNIYDFYGNISENLDDKANIHFTNLNNSNSFKNKSSRNTLADTILLTFNELEELLDNIVQSVTTNIPKINEDADLFLIKIRNYTDYALNIISNKVSDAGDGMINGILYNVERQLSAVKVEFRNIAESVDQRFEWAVNELNQTLINNTDEYDWWTSHIKYKLRSVNDSKIYKDGCKAVDDFIYRSNLELQNCCKIAMKPMKTLCRDAGTLLTESLHVIVDAIDRMQTCLEDNKSYSDYLVPCINLAYNDINSFLKRVMEVRHFMDDVIPIKIIYTRNCFAIVIVDMAHRRNVIESKLFE